MVARAPPAILFQGSSLPVAQCFFRALTQELCARETVNSRQERYWQHPTISFRLSILEVFSHAHCHVARLSECWGENCASPRPEGPPQGLEEVLEKRRQSHRSASLSVMSFCILFQPASTDWSKASVPKARTGHSSNRRRRQTPTQPKVVSR